jgi:two-component system alkaline phosphatase synthesis response regulator PhoP
VASILVVEDNADLAFGLRTILEFEGHDVRVAEDGPAGLSAARSSSPDLVILDLMLPEKSGYEVLRDLRGAGSHMPVLILTARSEERDVVLGFDSGADDYVTKPFSTLELLARVRALLRRSRQDGQSDAPPDTFGDVEIDAASRVVRRAGEVVELTPKEFDLLAALLKRKGAVASRSELLTEVWQYGNADVATRTVDVHIAELRRKLEADPSKPGHILTVRKAGYRLKP